MNTKFALFGGCLGNGTTVCNKAVEEYGESKKIAHISNTGHITWYIPPPEPYVPAADIETIQMWSKNAREEFLSHWSELSDLEKYQIILEEIPLSKLLQHHLSEKLKECRDLHKKVDLLETVYFIG